MRWLLILCVACLLARNSAAQTPTRWTLSAGPEWSSTLKTGHFYGGRMRAEYDLIAPTNPFRLRLEAGTFWSPTQSYFGSLIDGSTYYGAKQSVDLTFGLSAALTPLPRARLAPYVLMGVLARQRWTHGFDSFRNPDGSFAWNNPERSWTFGDVLFTPGIGIRARIGGHMFQLEMRHYEHRSLTLGTNLPF